jgi:hypothetical protein
VMYKILQFNSQEIKENRSCKIPEILV